MPALLTASEFAAALKVEPSTVYRWAREGVLPSVRLGGVVRIPARELERVCVPAGTHDNEETP
jgi:excisionase family DNA binding protein